MNTPSVSVDERIQRLNALICQRRAETRRRDPHPAKLAHFSRRIELYRGWIELDPYLYSPPNWAQIQKAVEALQENPYTG